MPRSRVARFLLVAIIAYATQTGFGSAALRRSALSLVNGAALVRSSGDFAAAFAQPEATSFIILNSIILSPEVSGSYTLSYRPHLAWRVHHCTRIAGKPLHVEPSTPRHKCGIPCRGACIPCFMRHRCLLNMLYVYRILALSQDWSPYALPVRVDRNITITGASPNPRDWPLIDLRALLGKVGLPELCFPGVLLGSQEHNKHRRGRQGRRTTYCPGAYCPTCTCILPAHTGHLVTRSPCTPGLPQLPRRPCLGRGSGSWCDGWPSRTPGKASKGAQ